MVAYVAYLLCVSKDPQQNQKKYYKMSYDDEDQDGVADDADDDILSNTIEGIYTWWGLPFLT